MQWESEQRKAKIEAIKPKKDKNFKEKEGIVALFMYADSFLAVITEKLSNILKPTKIWNLHGFFLDCPV